jgi:hypothetical protein
MASNVLFRLVGLGRFQINQQGHLTGHQKSSITALQGQAAKLQNGSYDLKGRVTLEGDGTGSAEISFTKTSGDGLNVNGTFNVLVAGTADRLWFVSAGGTVPPSNMPADELVSLEAVRF